MTWRDAISMACREVRRRSGRALLTMLAVALAAALLAALLAIAGTARTRVLSQLSHGGSLAGITVEANFPNPADESLDNPVPGAPNPITASALSRMRRLAGVASVQSVVTAPVEVVPPSATPKGSALSGQATPFSTSVVGASVSRQGALPVTLIAGRLPLAGSLVEVVVGTGYLSQLGLPTSRADEVVGTRIEVANDVGTFGVASEQRVVQAEIVGVVDQQLGAGDIVAAPRFVDDVYSSEAGSARVGDPQPPIAGAIVIAKELTDVTAVRSEIATLGYSTSAPVGIIVSVGRYLHVVELVLSGIGFVALAIAALGIANALLAAVRERRREIGVLKAIGARNRDVLRVFLVEAAVLGLLGGVVGTAAGLAMAALIDANANGYLASQGLAGVALSVPWLLPVGTIAGAVVVSLLAGWLPARRAARLSPKAAVDA